MSKQTDYQQILRSLADWEPYLRQESNLPGPRGNLELAWAAAEEASPEQIEQLLAFGPETAPENTSGAFLCVCGVIGLGRLLAEGQAELFPRLRAYASDPRWRVREAVAMALQRMGDASMDRLLESVRPWARGGLLEQRALAAGLCEPRLLHKPQHARAVLGLLDEITRAIPALHNRKTEDFQVLRKGLGYCWSVAVAALPAEGKTCFEALLAVPDPDIRWILRENLKKNRLLKMDAGWVEEMNRSVANAI
jgi:hypothetical protein